MGRDHRASRDAQANSGRIEEESLNAASLLEAGQKAYGRSAWGTACTRLRAADAENPLGPDDLQRLATAAYLTGDDQAAVDAWGRAHQLCAGQNEVDRAARCAFWIGMILAQRSRLAEAGGWFARGQRMLDESGVDCAERGYLLVPAALQALEGDPGAAHVMFSRMAEIADRFGDVDLTTLARLGQGQALIAMGDARRGVTVLDEAMVSVTAGEVSPIVRGIVYCGVILSCRDVFDLRRAQEWTAALTRWCDAQEDLAPFRGQCLVHRSEILELRGEWSEAMEEAERACRHLSEPPGNPVMGMARYQQAELLRLRGDLSRAELAYREAGEMGHPVQPGLVLLRLAQGKVEEAAATIRRVLAETGDDLVRRSRVLAAHVEVMLAAGDVAAARGGADEMSEISAAFASPYLAAVAAQATGAVLLADGQPQAACAVLRRASALWQEVEAPYDAARARCLLAQACRAVGDDDTADLELDAARRVFTRLRAAPALAEVARLADDRAARTPGPLSPRELEVLRLVATGATNRDIAGALVISEKTVARHVSNIFTKLGLSSRAAATAYAYEHRLT